MESEEVIPHDLPKIGNKTLVVVAIVALFVFAIVFFVGWLPRHRRISERNELAHQIADEKPVVQLTQAKPGEMEFDLTLPADVKPFASTALFVRTTGFLDHWNADINDRVKKGDLLAVIAAPDTDADLNQAKANLDQANANVVQQQTNYDLSVVTFKRYDGLVASHSVTQQTLDQFQSAMTQAQASLGAAKANVKSSQAAVDRLEALQGFEKIYAPFDGVITARNYDRGALLNAANTATGQELYDIAQDDQLRVYVNVPQSEATLIKYDHPVSLVLRNYPDKEFPGTIARSAGVLDPSTRTLRTELDFPNADHLLIANMYGQAKLKITRDTPVFTIPTSAMLFEANGTQVAVVDDSNHVHFRKITVGRDLGTDIEVSTGLTASDRIIANPGEKLTEGGEVAIAPQTASPAPQAPKTASDTTQPTAKGLRVAATDPPGQGK